MRQLCDSAAEIMLWFGAAVAGYIETTGLIRAVTTEVADMNGGSVAEVTGIRLGMKGLFERQTGARGHPVPDPGGAITTAILPEGLVPVVTEREARRVYWAVRESEALV